VEPGKLEQWFVVPGYRTPADRMRVDARPGGRLEAVMDLSYEFVSWPGSADPDASKRGVDDMLDHIEAGIERGTN
jgi:hypothetical protein